MNKKLIAIKMRDGFYQSQFGDVDPMWEPDINKCYKFSPGKIHNDVLKEDYTRIRDGGNGYHIYMTCKIGNGEITGVYFAFGEEDLIFHDDFQNAIDKLEWS